MVPHMFVPAQWTSTSWWRLSAAAVLILMLVSGCTMPLPEPDTETCNATSRKDAVRTLPHSTAEGENQNEEKRVFEYDEKGRLTRKVTASQIKEIAYDAVWGKISRVVLRRPESGTKLEWFEYEYDATGRMSFARNWQGQEARIEYNDEGLISATVDENDQRLSYRYGANGKPVEISVVAREAIAATDGQGNPVRVSSGTLEGGYDDNVLLTSTWKHRKVGAISVTYDNENNIGHVENEGGTRVALAVTRAHQRLLGIIQPAHLAAQDACAAKGARDGMPDR